MSPEFLQTTSPLECCQPTLTKGQPLISWDILKISKLVSFLSQHLTCDTDSIHHHLHYPQLEHLIDLRVLSLLCSFYIACLSCTLLFSPFLPPFHFILDPIRDDWLLKP